MGSTREEELVGLVATFTRVWRAGGSASLTLASRDGHLGANLDISIGHFGGDTEASKTPGPTIDIKDGEQEEGEEVHKVVVKKDRDSVVDEATMVECFGEDKNSQTDKQQTTIEEYKKIEDLLKEVETKTHVTLTLREMEAKEHVDDVDTEEHVAIPGPDDQPAQTLSDSDSGVLDMNSGEGRKLPTEEEELKEKAPLHPKAFPSSIPAGQTCTVIARGTIKRSPHPAMREEEAEAVRRYLEADVGSVSDIKVLPHLLLFLSCSSTFRKALPSLLSSSNIASLSIPEYCCLVPDLLMFLLYSPCSFPAPLLLLHCSSHAPSLLLHCSSLLLP